MEKLVKTCYLFVSKIEVPKMGKTRRRRCEASSRRGEEAALLMVGV